MMPMSLLLWLKKKRSNFSPERKQRSGRWKGVVRVIAYGAVAGTFVGALSMHSARADMGESSIALGHQLMPLADLFQENNQIVMNGQPIFVSTAKSDESMKMVLDRFETNCRAHNPAFSQIWKDIPALPKIEKAAHKTLPDLSVVRREHESEGTVMCMVREDGAGFMQSMREFTKTRDLSKIGELRYAYVVKQPKSGGSFVITAWTQGPFDLAKLVPEKGNDAFGTDSNDYPRPPSSQRFLTANVAHTPYGVRIYRSQQDPKAVVDFYEKEMDTRGWAVIAPPNMGDGGRLFQKENVQIVLASGKNKQGETVVSFAEMGVAPDRQPAY